ncbi:hypothetical protein MTP99_014424 [Tenebrio molitor]|nr:hypothetical protein MTP99_014424 [Tenebrio molitor]
MENSPLNKAHQLDRRAEALLKQKKFDETMECHNNAMRYLYEALQLTENPRSKESIQLQIDHHHKQRNYDEDYLKSFTCDDEKSSSSTEVVDTTKVSGKKRQVDDATLLEEFRGLSERLREFVQLLVLQLEDKDREINRLKAEIYKLECEKNKDGAKSGNTLKVITDSSGGTSPYVFSPCSELSPEVQDIRGLPALAPLEMPNFDFSSLIKNTKNLNLNGTNN